MVSEPNFVPFATLLPEFCPFHYPKKMENLELARHAFRENFDRRCDEVMDALRRLGNQMGIDINQYAQTRVGMDTSLKATNVLSHRVFPRGEKRSHQFYVNPYDRHVREPLECPSNVEKEIIIDDHASFQDIKPSDLKKVTITNIVEPLEYPFDANKKILIQNDQPSVNKEAIDIEVMKPIECPSDDIKEIMTEHPTHPFDSISFHSNTPIPKSATPISSPIHELHTEVRHHFFLCNKPFANDYQCFKIFTKNDSVMTYNFLEYYPQHSFAKLHAHDFGEELPKASIPTLLAISLFVDTIDVALGVHHGISSHGSLYLYLVCWKGFSDSDATWHIKDELSHLHLLE